MHKLTKEEWEEFAPIIERTLDKVADRREEILEDERLDREHRLKLHAIGWFWNEIRKERAQ